MIYKGVIFDLDGTILDSIPIWSKVGEEFLFNQGITRPIGLTKTLKKKSLRQAADYMRRNFKIDFAVEEIIEEINYMMELHYEYFIPLKPYVREFLNHLKDNNIKMCIATASNKKLVKNALGRLGVLSYFAFILTNEEVGKGKDEPDIYIRAAQRLGYRIKEILIFEDSLHCIETAKKAGFKVVGVYDQSSEEHIKKIRNNSDYFIYSFKNKRMIDFSKI